MKLIFKALQFFVIAFSLTAAPSVLAKTQMLDYCFLESDPEDAVCKAYVQGFLDGSVITDAAIVDRLTEEGTQNLVNTPATFYADFCLPAHVSVEQAAEQVFFQLVLGGGVDKDISAAVYSLLKQEFPCI